MSKPEPTLAELIEEVEQQLKRFDGREQCHDGRWYPTTIVRKITLRRIVERLRKLEE